MAAAGPRRAGCGRRVVRLGRDRADDRVRRDPPAARHLGLPARRHRRHPADRVEAYAAFALHAWLTSKPTVSDRTRRFARWSAIAALILGMAGQVAYHLLAQAGVTRAPWEVTTWCP